MVLPNVQFYGKEIFLPEDYTQRDTFRFTNKKNPVKKTLGIEMTDTLKSKLDHGRAKIARKNLKVNYSKRNISLIKIWIELKIKEMN